MSPTASATGPAHRAGYGEVPGTFQQIITLARWQWRDYLRARRFMILMGLVIVIGVIMTAVVAYFRPGFTNSPTEFYRSLWGGGATFIIVLTGIFFGGDAIAGEFQNKTGYFLMGLPIRRVTVYAGKFLAALSASFVVILTFLAIIVGNGIFYLGVNALPWQLGASFGLALLYLLALLGFTFFFSSIFKTTTYATILTAVLFLFGFNILQVLITFLAQTEPWMVISYSADIVSHVFSDPYPPHISQVPAGPNGETFTVYNPTIATGVAIMVGYLVASAVAGLWFFERKEFS